MRKDGRHMPWVITAALVEPDQDDHLIVMEYAGHFVSMDHNQIMQHTMAAAAIANVFIETMTGVKHE